MPIAIIFSASGVIPAIIKDDAAAALVARLNGLVESPALKTVADAREWLASLPEPSGWFETTQEAFNHTERLKAQSQATPEEVKEARVALEMSRADFAAAIGIGGNSNTRHKTMMQIENQIANSKTGVVPRLSIAATRNLRGLMAQKKLKKDAN